MKRIFTIVLSITLILSSASMVQAKNKNDMNEEGVRNEIIVPSELLYYSESDTNIASIQSSELNSIDDITLMLDELMDKKIELMNENKDIIGTNLELDTLYSTLEKNGAIKLSQNQVDQIYLSKQEEISDSEVTVSAKPYVPADTKKYDFFSISTTILKNNVKYDVFYIYVQPTTYTYGNMLIKSNDTYQTLSSLTLGSNVAKSTLFSVYSQKALSTVLDKVIKYGSLIPFEILWPSGNYTGTSTKFLVDYDLYTTLCFIYVSEYQANTYDQIISTSMVKASFNFKTAIVNKDTQYAQVYFTSKSSYYSDGYKAATFFISGDFTNHYYPFKSMAIKDVNKKTLLKISVTTVSSLSELN